MRPQSLRAAFLAACTLLLHAHRVQAQGQSDGTFTAGSGANQAVEAIAVQPDGKVLIGGGFTFYNGVARPGIARVNEDGSLDASFDPGLGANGVVRDIVVRSDGKILIAGDFTTYAGATSNRIALLSANGVPETSFNAAGVDGPINDMDLDGSGNILIGGEFTHCEGEVRNKVARLQPNGNLDPSFDPGQGANGTVFAVLARETGGGSSVLVGGDFTTFGGHTAGGLYVLNNDGTATGDYTGVQLDGSGIPAVRTMVLWNDPSFSGTVPLIGGDFTSIDGSFAHYVASNGAAISANGPDAPVTDLATSSDGHIYLAGTFQHYDGVARAGLARVNADGTLDASFTVGSGVNGLGIHAIALDQEERVLIGGGFTQYDGSAANRLARICIGPQQTWYPDVDGDGQGTTDGAINTCGAPQGYVTVCCDPCPLLPNKAPGNQCDDGDPATIYDLVTNDCVCAGKSGTIVTQFPWDQQFNGLGTGGFVYTHDQFLNTSGGNQWMIGTATGDAAPSLYVTDQSYLNTSSPNHYSTGGGSSTSEFEAFTTCERQLILPNDASALTLSLRWKGMGVPGRDYLEIFMGPQEQPPDENWFYYHLLPGNQWVSLSGELSGQADWTDATLTIPPAFAGRSVWVEFVWIFHAGPGLVPNNPPAAIDNIHLCATTTWFGDADGDGFGDPAVPGPTTCGVLDVPPGYASNALDDCPSIPGRVGSSCDDGDPTTVADVLGLNCTCAGTGLPWSEDFGNGAGGFATAQAGQNDRWYWGHAAGHAQPAWSISADGGATLSYDLSGTPSISHLLHDLPVIPANATSVQLGFDHLALNFQADGHLQVWLVPLSFTPVAGTAITASGSAPNGRVLLADYSASLITGWITERLTFPAGYAGSPARLVFQWQDSGTTAPGTAPTAIDNIHLCVITPTSGDADGDGIADCMDPCPMLAGLANGASCDDFNPTTINDVVTDCVCAGSPFFLPGGIVALRVGNDANDPLAATGDPIRLIGFSSDLIQFQQVSIPVTGNNALIITGNSALEGTLALSGDSTKLVFAGYAKSLPSSTTLASSSGSSIPRAIGTVDAAGSYVREATSTAAFSGSSIRGAVSNGSDLWAVGATQGVNYFGAGTPATIATGKTSLQTIGVFGGQLYACASSVTGTPSQIGVYKVGESMPTTAGQTLTTLINSANGATTSFYLNNAGTIGYVAIGAGGIQKWVNSGGTWTKVYTLTFSQGAHNMIADFSGAVPVLYTTSNDGSQLLKIVDPNSGTGLVAVTPQVFGNVGTNHAWRGLALAPHPCVTHTWYADLEGDGFGDPTMSTTACGPAPANYVADHTDNCPQLQGKAGSACNDNNGCTVNDVLNANCQCVGTPSTTDTDADGIADCADNCPTVPGQVGSACNDGNACTINDVLNTNCQCVGTLNNTDTDGDGVPNCADNCPNVSGQQGSACNDNNACTINDVLNASCQCVGTFQDTDGDGVCDAQDNCPNAVGQHGSSCNDGNAATVGDALNASCVCAGVVPTLAAKLFLQGPLDTETGLMSDALRTLGSFPMTEPYTALGLPPTTGATTILPAVLSVSGSNAIVDWVLVELRSLANPSLVMMRRCALLQRDGDVVDLDGVSALQMPGASGLFLVAFRHRNHLGAMTLNAASFGTVQASVNMTVPGTVPWGTNACLVVAGKQMLYMGDSNGNGIIKYTGADNDRDPVLVTVGSTTPNNTTTGYSGNDTDLNGQVTYTGIKNDRDPILLNVGSTTPNNVRVQQLP